MKFQGRVKQILPLRSGISQKTGNEWKALPFIFEYYENDTDRFPDTVVLETRDTNVIDNLKEGMEIVVGFYHRTHEYEGRWFNELKVYSLESVARASQQPPQTAKPAEPNNNPPGFERPATDDGNGDNDDLPF